MSKTVLGVALLAIVVIAFVAYLWLGMRRSGEELKAGQRSGNSEMAEASMSRS